MTRVHADIEALNNLREKIIVFADRQTEALECAEREIELTTQLLNEARIQCGLRLVRNAQAIITGLPDVALISEHAHVLTQAKDCLTNLEAWQKHANVTSSSGWQEILHWAELAKDLLGILSFAGKGYGLVESASRLVTILEWQDKLRKIVMEYRAASQHYSDYLRIKVPRANQFLDNRIHFLEDYYATNIRTEPMSPKGIQNSVTKPTKIKRGRS